MLKYFSFLVKTEFESSRRFDQCGVVMYLDSDYCIECSEDGIHFRQMRTGEQTDTNY